METLLDIDDQIEPSSGNVSDLLTTVNLPKELAKLYSHVGSTNASFSLERLRFRPLSHVREERGIVTFADETVSFTVTKTWSYHRVDDIVVSSDGDHAESLRSFLDTYVRREHHQRALNHQRYMDKCVDGVYVPSPDMSPSPAEFVND